MLALAGVLLAGAVCNWLVRPIDGPEVGAAAGREVATDSKTVNAALAAGGAKSAAWGLVIAFWCLVGLPLAWGVWVTLRQTWMLLG